jgi:hypothetical protein
LNLEIEISRMEGYCTMVNDHGPIGRILIQDLGDSMAHYRGFDPLARSKARTSYLAQRYG